MPDDILQSEMPVRIAVFAAVLLVMALWEVAAPRRRREIPRLLRWTNNLALVALDAALIRIAFPSPPSAWRCSRPGTAGGF